MIGLKIYLLIEQKHERSDKIIVLLKRPLLVYKRFEIVKKLSEAEINPPTPPSPPKGKRRLAEKRFLKKTK